MQSHPLTILVVDDSRANVSILRATFEDEGFKIHTALSVEEAQKQLGEHGLRIDLVLSDIKMPGLSGFDLVKWMKDAAAPIRDVPILLITSQLPDVESRVLGLSLGAVDYLLRSLDPKELVIRVRHVVEHVIHLRNLRESLERTETLASTGRLFAASNHEIKNVAQIIRIATDILLREVSAENMGVSDVCQQALKMLQQSSSLLSDITKMIGTLVGGSAAPLGAVDLSAVVEEVLIMVRPLAKGGILITSEVKLPVRVSGSSILLKQVLVNLILNAKDAIEEANPAGGGRVTVSIAAASPSEVRLTVKDNGVGLPEPGTRSDFPPFVSTKQLRGGTGLGLWLSAQLMQKMGGHLSLSSAGMGRGAEAAVVLQKAIL